MTENSNWVPTRVFCVLAVADMTSITQQLAQRKGVRVADQKVANEVCPMVLSNPADICFAMHPVARIFSDVIPL